MFIEDYSRKKNKSELFDASFKNVLEQRHLDSRLLDLEKLWHFELKNLTRERLELKRELQHFREEQVHAEHLGRSLQGSPLKNYSKDFRERLAVKQTVARLKFKYDFDHKQFNEKVSIRLPPIKKPVSILKINGTNAVYNEIEKPKFYRYHSNLSLRKSISDPDIFRRQSKTLQANSLLAKKNDKINASVPNLVMKVKNEHLIREVITPKNESKDKVPKLNPVLNGIITKNVQSVYSPERQEENQIKQKFNQRGMKPNKNQNVYDTIRENSGLKTRQNSSAINQKLFSSGIQINRGTNVYDTIRQGSTQNKRVTKAYYRHPSTGIVPRLVTTPQRNTRQVRSTDLPEIGPAPEIFLGKRSRQMHTLPPLKERCHTVL